jgi:TolA-binding protein
MKKLVLAAMLGLMATSAPAGALSLPKLFQGSNQPAAEQPREATPPPVILAQSNDSVRIQQLQEQIRQLTGRIEEMSFQLLQMQEQLRKTQEDNEFRFQDLEKKKRTEVDDAAGKPAVASNRAPPAQPPLQPSTAPVQSSDDVARIIVSPSDLGSGGATAPGLAPPPTTLGSI